MSDNDLIRRGVIKERMIARGWKHPDSTVTEFVEDDLPAVPQEMTAREYVREMLRLRYKYRTNSTLEETFKRELLKGVKNEANR